MSNSKLITTITDSAIDSYVDSFRSFGPIYYQIIAKNVLGNNIKSNIKTITGVIGDSAFIDDGGNVQDVEINSNGTVFLAKAENGLYAYDYNDSHFTVINSINNGGSAKSMAVGHDGTIFLANESDGLRAYSFDGSSFTNTAHINNNDEASIIY